MTKKGRLLTVGDIHGGHIPLQQCLERCNFDKEIDTLITLGDIVDGWPFMFECMELLLTIPNRIDIRGNHDEIFVEWMKTGIHQFGWSHGALNNAESYSNHSDRKITTKGSVNAGGETNLTNADIPQSHKDLLFNQKDYYVDEDRNFCFVHGGFNRHELIAKQDRNILIWDRDLLNAAMGNDIKNILAKDEYPFKIKDDFKKIFIGHTTTNNWNIEVPIITDKVIALDTAAAFNGKLSIMDVDTLEFWQSDNVKDIYPKIKGR